ncbi:uncharacterized protein N0V89_005592 [Didymosphaeria variabile]|uniref:Macro domain-containing protein n=1 Tax=Didymosphaeria variabile TaxID=1932322 RepID=A0A9W8XL18_9PLEO|nr:uncharacterized protein N0V89_005592 [Didymosphaeria variabile]KAJ4353862.1 hypothetical protein N0V89_005592 [Didymosphaeria variabile]
MKENLKTLAFCCLGTGGVGFPARIAARVALQEVREFLDAHPTHLFERIVFCVYAEDDSVAYTDFLSDFFPPTQEDVDAASSTPAGKNVAMVQEAYTQVDNVTEQVKAFSLEATNMPQRVAQELSSIAVLLYHFKEMVSENAPKHLLSRMMRYMDLLCSVMLAICGNMTEMIELARAKVNLGMPSHRAIWDDYNTHMAVYQGLTIVELIDISQEFARHLSDVLERDVPVPHEMKTIGIRLGAWLTKQTGEGPQSARDHFEEVMLTREYQRDVPVSRRTGTVKLFQVETLSQLYEQGVLQPKSTQATPSTRSNHIVCLANEDITRLEVDILGNTDENFSGIGRLDRTVFLGGGLELQKECANHAPCKEGEVVLTGGYALPVKHVLHAIPPAIYRTDALDVLRDMYRKILHMASYLRATSIAIPSLGTGMLNYPRRDSAAIAIREVKRFLENMDESNPIEKVVLVVYSSNDEFVYKSLLPAYFPPLGMSAESSEYAPSSPTPTPGRSRTLFGTLGEAFRKLTPSKQPTSNTRSLEPSEEDVLIIFETHAQGCPTCSKISEIYSQGRDLCDDGYRFAAQILRHLHMRADQSVYPLRSVENFPLEVEIPDAFPLSLELLQTVEKSFRDPERDRPFVSNQPSLELRRRIPEYTVYNIEITVSSPPHLNQTFDRIHIWSDRSSGWQSFEASLPTLHLTRAALLIRQGGYENVSKLPTRLRLSSRSTISMHAGTNIVVDDKNVDQDSAEELGGRFILEFRSQSDCEMLLSELKHAADNSPTYKSQEEPSPGDTTHDAEVTFTPRDQPKKAFARVSLWVEATESWEPFDAEQSEASLHIRPGSLEILQRASKFTWRLKMTSYSIIKQHSDVEILIDRITTAGDDDAGLGHWKRIMLKCRSQTEYNDLLASLQHAVDSSGRPPTPSKPRLGTRRT